MRARTYNIMQYEKHPTTGETLLTEDTIKIALAHKTIEQWAYIRHDKDTYSEKDEEDESTHKKGNVKPPHWHIVLKMKTNATELATIAKWFGIPENYVDVPKGYGAFMDCVQYLTHETIAQQEQGKHKYSDTEIQSNFDWRKAITEREERRAKYGKRGESITERQLMGQRILNEGLTLLQAMKEDPVLYADCYDFFKKMRGVYLANLKPPRTRINYYIHGDAGAGKGVMSKALARALFPDLQEDSEIFFEVGADGSLFEGYDGQPVIIWNDRRAGNLLKELGGRSNVYNVFDTHPSGQRQNVKYASVGLVNVVNIVNSVQPYNEFLEMLAGIKDENDSTYDAAQKSQSYRRFPLIIYVQPEMFDIYINKGYLSQEESYLEYEAHTGFYANMRRVAEVCSKHEEHRRLIESQTVGPVLRAHDRVNHSVECEEKKLTEMEALAEVGMSGMLDLRRSNEELEAMRERHRKAQEKRNAFKQATLSEYLNDDLPWG